MAPPVARGKSSALRAPRTAGVAGAAALGCDYADDLILGAVRDVHRAVAGRVFGLTGRATLGSSRLPQLLHDVISSGVYAGIGACVVSA